MKRYVKIVWLVLLALGAGGWGAIVAATVCPHANPGASVTVLAEATMPEDHACCPEKKAAPQEEAHCHDSGAEHEAMNDAGVERDGSSSTRFLGETEASCAHCMSRPEVPTSVTLAHKPLQIKRNVQATAQTALSFRVARIFTPPVIYRQGAPPGSSSPRHLLISVLLI